MGFNLENNNVSWPHSQHTSVNGPFLTRCSESVPGGAKATDRLRNKKGPARRDSDLGLKGRGKYMEESWLCFVCLGFFLGMENQSFIVLNSIIPEKKGRKEGRWNVKIRGKERKERKKTYLQFQ